MKEDMMEKFRSRKWRLTLLILFTTIVFAGVNMLSSELANVLTGLGVSYNGAQGVIDWQKAKSETV